MFPANQRFGLANLPVAQIDDRLVSHMKLRLLHSGAQIDRQSDPRLGCRLQRRCEKTEAVAAFTFGDIQGLVRIFEQVFNFGGVVWVERDADTGCHKRLFLAQLKDAVQRVQNFLQHRMQLVQL